MHPSTALFWVGMSLMAAGAWKLGGWRAAAWVPVGAAVIDIGPGALRATGDWAVSGVALRTFAGYAIGLAGTGLALLGPATGWRISRSAVERGVVAPPVEPALGAVVDT